MQKKTKCVFGPVPSRRLGLSLGIDLLPYKTCSMDCIYCECGATTNLTCKRDEYFPTESVIAELDAVLSKKPVLDYITFSGVGEPTLHSGIGRIIQHIRRQYPEYKICLLTNASLLNEETMLADLDGISLIVPSLDGSTEDELKAVNRQENSVSLKTLISGLIKYRKKYPDVSMWLEIFIVPGINDTPEAMERFRKLSAEIAPEKVQLNSLDRPGVVDWLRPETPEKLEEIASIIRQAVPVEIVARHKVQVHVPDTEIPDVQQYNDLILKTLRSRPCTAEDLSITLGIPADRIVPHLRRMERAGLLCTEEGTRGIFYHAKS